MYSGLIEHHLNGVCSTRVKLAYCKSLLDQEFVRNLSGAVCNVIILVWCVESFVDFVSEFSNVFSSYSHPI